MPPCQASRIEAVKIRFNDQALFEEIIVLFSARDRAKDVKRGPVWRDGFEHLQMVTNRFLGVVREADDIRKMGTDPVIATEPDNVVIRIGAILFFVRGDQCFPVKGFDSNEHLVATGPSKQFHKALLSGDLGIALNKELDLNFFVDHRLK